MKIKIRKSQLRNLITQVSFFSLVVMLLIIQGIAISSGTQWTGPWLDAHRSGCHIKYFIETHSFQEELKLLSVHSSNFLM